MYYCVYYGEVVELSEDYDDAAKKALSLGCNQMFKNDLIIVNLDNPS